MSMTDAEFAECQAKIAKHYNHPTTWRPNTDGNAVLFCLQCNEQVVAFSSETAHTPGATQWAASLKS